MEHKSMSRHDEEMECPKCGHDCARDSCHNGIAVIYGPWGCFCGWSEDSRYDRSQGECEAQKDMPNHSVNQWGIATPVIKSSWR